MQGSGRVFFLSSSLCTFYTHILASPPPLLHQHPSLWFTSFNSSFLWYPLFHDTQKGHFIKMEQQVTPTHKTFPLFFFSVTFLLYCVAVLRTFVFISLLNFSLLPSKTTSMGRKWMVGGWGVVYRVSDLVGRVEGVEVCVCVECGNGETGCGS